MTSHDWGIVDGGCCEACGKPFNEDTGMAVSVGGARFEVCDENCEARLQEDWRDNQSDRYELYYD